MAAKTRLEIGTLVASRYRLLDVLGKGGMGAVYRAEDVRTGAVVALKVLREDLYDREDLVHRFEREARAAARIGHENIVGVYAVGHDDRLRTRFIVEESLHGTDVAGCLNESGSLLPQTAVAIALSVMDALVAAHAAGIVHRDIKPENVFLHELDDGRVVPKVIDFGVAKITDELDRAERTATGMVFGTPWYMSPEQAEGASSVDARTDVWSVGAMLYEMLCGTLPFGGNNPNAVMAQIIYGRPTPLEDRWPDVPSDLRGVVHRALEHDVDRRYAGMQEFRDALAACAIWRGVTPAMAQGFLPRPSSFDCIDDILPAEFAAAPEEAPPPEQAPFAMRAEVPTAAPIQRAEAEPDDDDERVTTPRAPRLRRASERVTSGVLLGVGLALSLLCVAVLVLGVVSWVSRTPGHWAAAQVESGRAVARR